MILNANKIYLRTKAVEEYKNKKFLKETEKNRKKNRKHVYRDINNEILHSSKMGKTSAKILLQKEDFSLVEVKEIFNKYIHKGFVCNIEDKYCGIYYIHISWEEAE
jgi:hypothetical protein